MALQKRFLYSSRRNWYTGFDIRMTVFDIKVSRLESMGVSDTKESFVEGIRNNFFDTENSSFLCRNKGGNINLVTATVGINLYKGYDITVKRVESALLCESTSTV